MEQVVIKGQNIKPILDQIKLAESKINKILIITFKSAVNNQDIFKLIKHLSFQYQIKHILFSTQLFSVTDLEFKYKEIGKNFIPDLIIAIGGGSVLDLSKCLRYIYATHTKVSEIIHSSQEKDYLYNNNPVLFAIPTTAGTGSEATNFSVIYQNKKKYNIESDFLLPEVVFFIANWLFDIKFDIQVMTMLDALSQAIESLWAIHSSKESISNAQKAIQEIYYLLPFFENRSMNSIILIEKMQNAAYLAGKAINISKTTLAHALSYQLTANHSIPHGLAVFLNLPIVWKFNQQCHKDECLDSRGIEPLNSAIKYICSIFEVLDKESMPDRFQNILQRLNIPPYLSHYIKYNDYKKIIRNVTVYSQRTFNNPRKYDLKILLQIAKEEFSIDLEKVERYIDE